MYRFIIISIKKKQFSLPIIWDVVNIWTTFLKFDGDWLLIIVDVFVCEQVRLRWLLAVATAALSLLLLRDTIDLVNDLLDFVISFFFNKLFDFVLCKDALSNKSKCFCCRWSFFKEFRVVLLLFVIRLLLAENDDEFW
jgi:hypothetical protein